MKSSGPTPEMSRDQVLAWRLSEHVGNWLEITCCKGIAMYPLRLMTMRHGDATIGQVLARLRCERCHGSPRSVVLHEDHMTKAYGGSPAGWAVPLL